LQFASTPEIAPVFSIDILQAKVCLYMNRFFASLAATAALLFTATSSFAAIVITEVHSMGSQNLTYASDWFELTNTGAAAVDITGWKIDDGSNLFSAALPLTNVTSIAPGQSVVFMEISVANLGLDPTAVTYYNAFKSAWFGSSVPSGFTIGHYSGSGIGLSSTGDGANVFDSLGVAVPGANVTFPAGSLGISFDNAAGLSGAITTLSTVGVNGAFNSVTGSEVGSPGFAPSAVPEPSTWALMLCGLGGIGLVARRRIQR
jgi:hypothetical protein